MRCSFFLSWHGKRGSVRFDRQGLPSYTVDLSEVEEQIMEEREGFNNRLGFILVSAGCAIGIGNVWRFPYMVGENGGAVFVLFYLIFLVLMGVPVLTMELAVGRASGLTVMQGMKKLEKPGHKWHMHGWVCVIGSALLMMYYTTVSGWMLAYFWKFLKGDFENIGEDEIGKSFDRLTGDTGMMLIFVAIVVVLGFLVLSFGVQKGLEAVNKFMMIGLFGLILALVVNSILLKGSGEGIKFYLLPDFERAAASGWTNVISQSMTQAFFTLSVGIGTMEIFGSYMNKDHSLTGESIRIIGLDTFVALMAGLIIFPACFSYGVEPDQGPSLIFETLPRIFVDMEGGRIWGALFFLFMVFASFSTVTAVCENLVRTFMDNLGWSRIRSVIANFFLILFGSVPCVLGFSIWKDVEVGGMNVLSLEDFIVSNILLPGGSLVFACFCCWKFGWGAEKYLEETNTGKGIRMSPKLIPYFKYVLPLLILFILIKSIFQ